MEETQRVTGARRGAPGRGGGGSDRTQSIRRRQPARAAPQRRRIRSATSSRVRRQTGVGAGRPRNADRLRAPRDRRRRRRRRRPLPSPRQRSRRARQGCAVRSPGVRVLSGPSVFRPAGQPDNRHLRLRLPPSRASSGRARPLRTIGFHANRRAWMPFANRTCSLQCSQPSSFPPTPPRLLRTVHTCPRPRPCDVSRQTRRRRHPRQAVLRSADPRARPTPGSGCR